MSFADATFTEDTLKYDPEVYAEAGQQLIPTPGVYRFRALSLGRKKDKNGDPILRDGKWPILMINRVEIVDPVDESGSFAVFEEIPTKPMMRKLGGREVPAARHIDLMRAIDVETQVESFEEGIQEVEKLLSSGQTFVASLGYKAQDNEYAKARIADLGGFENAPREAQNAAWNDAKFTTKDFKLPGGGYKTRITGKSGKVLDAKLTLSKFYPSNANQEIGPYTK
jgi:hypothetical protein